MKEFHISKQARQQYGFDEALFAQSGNVVFTNFIAARQFAQQMNEKRDLVNNPDRAVRAGQINAMGLIDEVMHIVLETYQQDIKPNAMKEALEWLESHLGSKAVENTLLEFAVKFPPLVVYRQAETPAQYMAGSTQGKPNREILLEEMLMLWLANNNPAFSPFLDLFDDSTLEQETEYLRIFPLLHNFFDSQPAIGPMKENLIDLLRTPAIKFPNSLTDQLNFILAQWSPFIGKITYRLLSSMDLIREEEKAVFGTGGGEGVPAQVIGFSGLGGEPEAFSRDLDWMPSLVLLAKNSYVWLDQLSKKYQRSITHLDQIPDEELDTLARWGVTGLWLIGVWERSRASQTIKQLRGNPEAVASAYSLMDYQIAGDLGGEESYQELRRKAWSRGIRLASDMVPNHMGIDSNWVMEHPNWFISLPQSPFPSYTFNGPNLSWDNRVGIYLEDHYFNNSDAAVVFKRVDYWTGDTRYIYHGNDGTSMPWNDTAQLNYLDPEVREAVIQTILHVARKFPVIRFDAAMTLAKRHFQRLWFPEPGTGGDIPSRAGLGLTKEQFDAAIPVEFWREVVDRVALEVPDTLLLAEAFWMMEGYFVRTLGMHRVYNSAFMNMLRDEKNAEYRQGIKNTLEFDPQILKRYVNFMSNPDERTAVDQFGKGDKYFGISTVMVTLPGLPMLGHGQVQGFTEKYGMEYRKAYWEEKPDNYLVERHEREIFPLLRRRYLFAEVENFNLYDLFLTDGGVNEDVYAYSNKRGEEYSLVIYHNRFASARGWIKTAAPYTIKDENGNKGQVQHTLADGLGLENNPNVFTIYRDYVNGLEYIRNNRELHENGLYIELDAYKTHVFLDFRQVVDNEWHQFAQLASYLGGNGVPSIEAALKDLLLQPVHIPFKELINPGMLSWLIKNRVTGLEGSNPNFDLAVNEASEKAQVLLVELKSLTNATGDPATVAKEINKKLAALLNLPVLEDQYPELNKKIYAPLLEFLGCKGQQNTDVNSLITDDPVTWNSLLIWLFIHPLGKISGIENFAATSRAWIDELLLGKLTSTALKDLEFDDFTIQNLLDLVKVLTALQDWHKFHQKESSDKIQSSKISTSPTIRLLQSWLEDPDFKKFVNVNRYQNILWFNKEAFDNLLWWLLVTASIDLVVEGTKGFPLRLWQAFQTIQSIREAEKESGYQVEKLLDALVVKETKLPDVSLNN